MAEMGRDGSRELKLSISLRNTPKAAIGRLPSAPAHVAERHGRPALGAVRRAASPRLDEGGRSSTNSDRYDRPVGKGESGPWNEPAAAGARCARRGVGGHGLSNS
jgi:hypothetical protein